jgi:hypothetical protein
MPLLLRLTPLPLRLLTPLPLRLLRPSLPSNFLTEIFGWES